jgi:hypothetical protein
MSAVQDSLPVQESTASTFHTPQPATRLDCSELELFNMMIIVNEPTTEIT